MTDIENTCDIKNMTNTQDIMDKINKKIKETLKKIERRCKEQEYKLKKNNDLILIELITKSYILRKHIQKIYLEI